MQHAACCMLHEWLLKPVLLGDPSCGISY